MPELPEVETIKRQLKTALKGKKVKEVLVRMDKMVKVGSGKISNIKRGSKEESKKFAALLKGRSILDIRRRAKFLIFELSGKNFLFVHLRMSGQLIFAKSGAETKNLPGKHTHAVLTFTDSSKLFYNDYRQFGHMRVADAEEAKEVLAREALGPEPLEMNLSEFKKLIQKYPKKRAKDFLLNQKVIAGIGNIYADESLFSAKMHPDRKVSTFSEKEIIELYKSMQRVLKRAIELKGSSVRTYMNINGRSGKFASEHKVYGRAGQKCLRCGLILISKQTAGRTTVFCPACQVLV